MRLLAFVLSVMIGVWGMVQITLGYAGLTSLTGWWLLPLGILLTGAGFYLAFSSFVYLCDRPDGDNDARNCFFFLLTALALPPLLTLVAPKLSIGGYDRLGSSLWTYRFIGLVLVAVKLLETLIAEAKLRSKSPQES
jgi:hypothetical protein